MGAIGYFSRIQQANVLTKKDEDKYLVSLCRWPTRNRRGDMIELSSFWKNILVILEKRLYLRKNQIVEFGLHSCRGFISRLRTILPFGISSLVQLRQFLTRILEISLMESLWL